MPQVRDPRLKLELFAAEPDIVRPTGVGEMITGLEPRMTTQEICDFRAFLQRRN
ncbi:MAG: hypothetical protein IT427_00920 [Pirellulales bacterium]|nr:hypothetical protein [Pirellulales bacterium]